MLPATLGVTLNAIAAQLFGFLRTALIAAFLGATIEVDAYYISALIPSFISTIVLSWLQAGFVGHYAGLVALGNESAAKAYRSRMLFLVLFVSLTMSAICIWLPDWIVAVLVPTGPLSETTVKALGTCSIILAPVIVSDFIGLILNSHGRFYVAAAAPVVNALVSVLGLLLWPTIDLPALLWTLILGCVAQFAIVVCYLISMRLGFEWNNDFSTNGDVRSTAMIAMPLLPAIMITNSAIALMQIRSTGMGEGAVAVMSYAQRLNGAVTQVLVMGLGTVLLPHMASLLARNERAQIIDLLRRLVRLSILVCGYIGCAIYILGTPFVELLFARGSFNSELASKVADVWTILTLSLFPFAIGTFVAKVSQAMRRPRATLLSSIVLFAALWSMSLWGSKISSIEIVALSAAAAFSATAIFWLIWLSRSVGAHLIWTDIVSGSLRMIGVLLPATLFDRVVRSAVDHLPAIMNFGLRGMLYTFIVMGAVYLFGYWRWFLPNVYRDPLTVSQR
ncbi:MAG: lipid II flippase MurJ [Pseudomonadota bacterium]